MYTGNYHSTSDRDTRLADLYDFYTSLGEYARQRSQIFRDSFRDRERVKQRFQTKSLEETVNRIKDYSLDHNSELENHERTNGSERCLCYYRKNCER